MNYRHAYHVGNPADVFKHIVLIALLQHLKRKESGFFVLDTHAGIGRYDLNSIEAGKTGEFAAGIGKLWTVLPETDLLADYLAEIRKINGKELHAYPGSPIIIRDQIRVQDNAACCELHNEDYKSLKAALRNSGIAAHHRDAYEGLNALLPPKQTRGLVLIDPPFENHNEFETLPQAIAHGYKRFAQGIWALWYPIKDRPGLWQFEEAMIATGIKRQMVIEFMLDEERDSRVLNGSAMLLINPPYGVEAKLLPALSEAVSYLSAKGKVTSKWLVQEH